MTRRKWRDLLILLAVGLFFLTHSLVFIWLMVGVIIVFHQGKSGKGCYRTPSYEKDAKRLGIEIPDSSMVHRLLRQIYERRQQSERVHPQLASQYGEIIDELWQGLAFEPSKEEWILLLRKVLNDWPVDKRGVEQNLRRKIDKVREMSQQWQDAKTEVYGGG